MLDLTEVSLQALLNGEQVSIVNGPTKFDMMVQFFGVSGLQSIPAEFTVWFEGPPAGDKVRVNLQLIKRESGDGNSWIYAGDALIDKQYYRVHGFYSSKRHDGHMLLGSLRLEKA